MTEKQKYTVGLTRLAVVYEEVEVEATTPEKAAKAALKRAKNEYLDWQIDDVYDDGKPHSCISVSQVHDEIGDSHDVGDMSVMP